MIVHFLLTPGRVQSPDAGVARTVVGGDGQNKMKLTFSSLVVVAAAAFFLFLFPTTACTIASTTCIAVFIFCRCQLTFILFFRSISFSSISTGERHASFCWQMPACLSSSCSSRCSVYCEPVLDMQSKDIAGIAQTYTTHTHTHKHHTLFFKFVYSSPIKHRKRFGRFFLYNHQGNVHGMFCYDQAIVHNSQAIVHNSQAIVHNGQSSEFLFLTAKARKNANKQNMTLSQKSHHPVISVWKKTPCVHQYSMRLSMDFSLRNLPQCNTFSFKFTTWLSKITFLLRQWTFHEVHKHYQGASLNYHNI